MINKILIIHASRERAERGVKAAQHMINTMTSDVNFKYIFSLDIDDPQIDLYKTKIKDLSFTPEIIINNNNGCVSATNFGAALISDEDLIFVNTDDIGFPVGWDTKLIKFINSLDTNFFLIHFKNFPNSENGALIQCLSKNLYLNMGHLFYPEYISMFADNDLLYAAKARNAVIEYTGEEIKFEHEHPTYGKADWDNTYKRTNKPEAYSLGSAILHKRRLNNFGI